MAKLYHRSRKPRPKYQSITLRYLKYLWIDRLTPAGKVLLGGIALSGIGLISVQAPIYQLFCLLTGLYLCAWFAGRWYRPKVRASGEFPERTVAGEPIRGVFTISNQSRRAAFDLCAGFTRLPSGLVQSNLDAAIPALRGGETANVTVELLAVRRGLYELPPLRVYTTFPFGFLRSGSTTHPLASLLVLPTYHTVERVDVPFTQRYQPGGVALTSNVGESPEYIGNREYIPGEPARRIDFRSWARLGRPVVREYQEEYYCRIALVLDTFIAPGRKAPPAGFAELEAAISLAASVAQALSLGEYLLDVFAAGPDLYVFRSGRHTAHFENILEILSSLDACRQNPFDTVAPAVAEELSSMSSAICVLLDWDESRQLLVRNILEAGCAVKVLLVCEGPTTLPIEEVENVEFSRFTPADVARGGFESL